MSSSLVVNSHKKELEYYLCSLLDNVPEFPLKTNLKGKGIPEILNAL